MVIRQDWISIGLTGLAVMLLLFLSTFGADLMLRSVFAVSLIVAGFALSYMTKTFEWDNEISSNEYVGTIKYVFVSLGVITLLASMVPKISLDIDQTALSGTDLFLVPRMFGVLIAVAEETFFRLYAANYFVSVSSQTLGILGSATLFAVYHLAVYGTDYSLMIYVLGAGLILSYVAVKTQRVSTTMIAHVIVNAVA